MRNQTWLLSISLIFEEEKIPYCTPELTNNGCMPAGNPFGNNVVSLIGTSRRLYGDASRAAVASEIGMMKVAKMQ